MAALKHTTVPEFSANNQTSPWCFRTVFKHPERLVVIHQQRAVDCFIIMNNFEPKLWLRVLVSCFFVGSFIVCLLELQRVSRAVSETSPTSPKGPSSCLSADCSFNTTATPLVNQRGRANLTVSTLLKLIIQLKNNLCNLVLVIWFGVSRGSLKRNSRGVELRPICPGRAQLFAPAVYPFSKN